MSNITVNSYNIYVAFNFYNMCYIGKVEINIILKDNCNLIILNANQLKILDLQVNNEKKEYIYNPENKVEQIIKINGSFKKGKNIIKILFFNKIIRDSTGGIYYMIKNNKTIVITDLEPNDARKFIPCFDEPSLKSKFNLNISIPIESNAISNMEIKEIKKYNDVKIIKFNETPLMSTYLLCLVIGDIVPFYNSNINKTIPKINGYSFSEDIDKIEWTINKVKESLDFFEEWFSIPYPLEKLDIVSVPVFSSAAMENWGIIVYNNKYCFYNKNMSDKKKINLLEVTYHEVTHQWFGNLVTLNNWSNIWLNESTATYFSWIALDNQYPNYFIKDFTFIDRKHIYITDGITSSSKILIDNTKDNSKEDYFNEITYEKGCLIINYVVNLLGISEFRKNVSEYLKEYSYKNTSTNDFIKCFGKYNNLLLKMINITGYPIINIKYNKEENNISIKILKFNLDKDKISNYSENLFLRVRQNNDIKLIFLNNNEYKIDVKDNRLDNLYINPDNDLFCICMYEEVEPNILNMNSCEIIKYCYDEFILTLYGYSNLKKYLRIIKKVFNKINLIDYPLLLLSLLEDINKLFMIYSLSNINPRYLVEFIINNLYLVITELFSKCKNILYSQNIIGEILKLIVINLKNTSFVPELKKIYYNELESKKYYLMDILIIIMNKYDRDNYSLLLKKIKDDKNLYDLFISNSDYFDKEEIINLLNIYEKHIKKGEFRDLLSILNKNIQVQSIIIEYVFGNKDKLIKVMDDVFYKLLKNISLHIFYELNIDKMLELINLIDSKNNHIVINQIKDILQINKKVYNNLII